MKVVLVGLIFLGYFQLFAFECPYGDKFKLIVSCQPGNEALALNNYYAEFELDLPTSEVLSEENSSKAEVYCLYLPTTFSANYTLTTDLGNEAVRVQSNEDINALLSRMNELDPNFPGWYDKEWLNPEFRYIDAKDPLKKKNYLKIGVGMTFNGKVALEKSTTSYNTAVSNGLNATQALYVVANVCRARIQTENGPVKAIGF